MSPTGHPTISVDRCSRATRTNSELTLRNQASAASTVTRSSPDISQSAYDLGSVMRSSPESRPVDRTDQPYCIDGEQRLKFIKSTAAIPVVYSLSLFKSTIAKLNAIFAIYKDCEGCSGPQALPIHQCKRISSRGVLG